MTVVRLLHRLHINLGNLCAPNDNALIDNPFLRLVRRRIISSVLPDSHHSAPYSDVVSDTSICFSSDVSTATSSQGSESLLSAIIAICIKRSVLTFSVGVRKRWALAADARTSVNVMSEFSSF